MWPLVLDLTRDECRGILRRSELQSYSSVVNTFRAQGGLNETKSKILTELREIFHISLDRHRAEARRVANDERLSTVADVMAGPNTRQEWIMEGRRTFPFLPRVAPCTGLSVIVNDAIDTANALNEKLQMPCDTARDISTNTEVKTPVKILTEDPIKEYEKEFANYPTVDRVNNQPKTKTPAKKRISSTGNSTNIRIQQLYNRHTKTQLTQNRKTHTKRTTLAKISKSSSPQKSRKTKSDLHTTTSSTSSTLQTTTTKKTPKNVKTEKAKKSTVTKVQKLSANSIIILPPQQNEQKLPQDKGETLNQLWTPTPHSSSSSSGNTFSNVIAPNALSTITNEIAPDDSRPPPVQIVFTSQIETVGDSSNYQSIDTDPSTIKNNLITESTPITWISKPSESPNNQQHRTKKMILLPSSIGKTLSTTSPINHLPSAADNTISPTSVNINQNQALKTNIRRKAIGGGNIVQELIVDSNILNGVNYVSNTVPSTTKTLSPNAPTIIDNQLIVPARSSYTIATSSTAQNIQQPTTIVAVSQNQQLSLSSSSSSSNPQIGTTIVTTKNTIGKITKPILFAKTISGNTITTTGANAKNLHGLIPIVGSQPIQLKTLQSRGNVKLISSGGKVILKTTNNDDGKVTTTSSPNIRRLLKGVVNQGPFQKMQLLPATNASGKTNLVFMQRAPISTTTTTTTSSSSNIDSGNIKTFVNHITSVGGEKIAIYPGTGTKIDGIGGGTTMAEKLASGNLLSGLLTAGKAATAGITTSSTIINEDTPVDILPSDGIYDPSAAEPTQSAIIIQSPTSQSSAGTIDIINKQIIKSPIKFKTGTTLHTINRAISGGVGISSISTTSAATSIVQNYDVRKRKAITIKTSPTTATAFDNNNKRPRMETYVLDANVQIKTNNNNAPITIAAAKSPSPGQVINTTDWEKELDQANSMKAATSSSPLSQSSSSSSITTVATTTITDSANSEIITTKTTTSTPTKTTTTTIIPEITNETTIIDDDTAIDELIEEDSTMIDEMVTESIVDDETQVIECDETSFIAQI